MSNFIASTYFAFASCIKSRQSILETFEYLSPCDINMCHIFTLLNSYRHTTLICVTFSPRATLRIYSLHWLHWLVRDSILGKFLFNKKRAWKLSRLQRFLTKSIESMKPGLAFVAIKMIPFCVGLDVGAILLDPPEDVPTLIFLFVGASSEKLGTRDI